MAETNKGAKFAHLSPSVSSILDKREKLQKENASAVNKQRRRAQIDTSESAIVVTDGGIPTQSSVEI